MPWQGSALVKVHVQLHNVQQAVQVSGGTDSEASGVK
jgi:hypothetical protein